MRAAACRLLNTALWLLAFSLGTPAGQFDYLLLQTTAPFTLLNRYEQPASAQQRAWFLPGAPLRIDENKTTLGDGLTPALRGSFRGSTWFLQRGEDGRLLGDQPSRRTVLNNCIELDDTMVVATGGTVSFSTRADGSAARRLAAGEQVYRVFSRGEKTYGLVLGDTPAYGWLSGRGLTPVARQAGRTDVVDALAHDLEIISERIELANAAYRTFFSHFTRISGTHKSAPVWSRAGSGTATRWTLSAPYERGGLHRSTEVLLRELQGLMAGRAISVVYDSGVIRLTSGPAVRHGR